MSHFTLKEIEYLQSQRLGRLATINAAGEPHVVPIAFRYNADLDAIELGGRFFGRSKKFRDMQRNPLIAFVVDDAPGPGQIRGIELRGRAQVFTTGGEQAIRAEADPEFIRILPTRIVSWGIDTDPYHPSSRKVVAAVKDADGV
jgi:pyridoxamine 5'-phosphate oxidase family protein